MLAVEQTHWARILAVMFICAFKHKHNIIKYAIHVFDFYEFLSLYSFCLEILRISTNSHLLPKNRIRNEFETYISSDVHYRPFFYRYFPLFFSFSLSYHPYCIKNLMLADKWNNDKCILIGFSSGIITWTRWRCLMYSRMVLAVLRLTGLPLCCPTLWFTTRS